MALYNFDNESDREKGISYFKRLLDLRCIVDLTKKKPVRSDNQNAYMHLIIGWFAIETGYSPEYVKREFFKIHCNSELFIYEKVGKLGTVKDLRSSADLDTAEMTTAIKRFRNWSASEEVGIYLPEPHEQQMLEQIRVELSRIDHV